jgi:hypothetical protein
MDTKARSNERRAGNGRLGRGKCGPGNKAGMCPGINRYVNYVRLSRIAWARN